MVGTFSFPDWETLYGGLAGELGKEHYIGLIRADRSRDTLEATSPTLTSTPAKPLKCNTRQPSGHRPWALEAPEISPKRQQRRKREFLQMQCAM